MIPFYDVSIMKSKSSKKKNKNKQKKKNLISDLIFSGVIAFLVPEHDPLRDTI